MSADQVLRAMVIRQAKWRPKGSRPVKPDGAREWTERYVCNFRLCETVDSLRPSNGRTGPIELAGGRLAPWRRARPVEGGGSRARARCGVSTGTPRRSKLRRAAFVSTTRVRARPNAPNAARSSSSAGTMAPIPRHGGRALPSLSLLAHSASAFRLVCRFHLVTRGYRGFVSPVLSSSVSMPRCLS